MNLSSNNPSVASVPATVTYSANSGTVNVPVTALAVGLATITATSANFGTATITVNVATLNGVSVTWYGACWAPLTLSGYTGNFQAIDFALSTPSPVPVQDAVLHIELRSSLGQDNMNDFGTTTGSTHMIQGFARHPDTIPSSAVYWIGNASTTGMCPPGSLCSGCVTYNKATPLCSMLP